MRSRVGHAAMALALIAVLGWPTLATVMEAWRESGSGSGGIVRPLGLALATARLVVATEAIALPVGVVLGLLLFRTDLWGRRALLGLTILMMLVPLPLHATAWLGAFGNLGRAQVFGGSPILIGWQGAAFVHAMAALPWVVLLAGVGLWTVEPELEESALLDLPAWLVLVRVTLRRAVGAVAGAALAVAVLTAGDMTVTDLLGIRTYAEEAYTQSQLGQGPASSAAVALPPLVVLGGAVMLAAWALLRTDPARLPSADQRARTWRLGRWRVQLGLFAWATVGNAVALPIYGLFWRAGRVGGSAALGVGPAWSVAGLIGTLNASALDVVGTSVVDSPLVNSLKWSVAGASATVALAWPLAWASRRAGPWRWVVAESVALMLASPGPMAGMALKLAYLRVPIIHDTPAILVLADVVRTLPYALLVLWPAVRAIPKAYLDAAALDGHGPWGLFWRVALPSTRGALMAAWGVAFVLAMGELPAANVVLPPDTPTLADLIWSLLHTGVESHLAGVGLVVLGMLGTVGLMVAWSLRRIIAP